ncbi:MAG: ABC transporter substrate-binding protein [Chloroflexi bacterium]|nr:ABC transporter substrate-binding protein [Chloroflexota bacterium]
MKTQWTSRFREDLATIATLLLVVAACAPAAPPTPQPPSPTAATKAAPAPAPAAASPAPAAKATPAPAAKGPSGELAQLIEAAKKEGRVSVQLQSGVEAQPIRDGIRKKYGVDLQIESQPSASYPAAAAQMIAEGKAGVTPSFDALPLSDVSSLELTAAGFVEKVDWAPLLAEGTPKEVIQLGGLGISMFTGHVGMIYNPTAIPSAEAPKTFGDLANPKWRGKIAAYNYANLYVHYAFVRGIEKTLPELRAFMKNEPPLEIYARGGTRYLAGEYPILLTSSVYLLEARNKRVPVEWVSLDVSWIATHMFHVMKGAKNPNAAKLIAVFLASPEGHKIYNDSGRGSLFYPGNAEFEIHDRDMKAGLPLFSPLTWPGAVEFVLSEKGKQLQDQVGRILQGE